MRRDRLQSARRLQERLDELATCLSNDVPSALKYVLSLLGLMHPSTRLPIVELDESAKARVARALADFTAGEPIGAAQA